MGKKNKSDGRNYQKEYANYQGKPEQIKNRAKRNAARAKLAKEGRVSKGDNRDVDHVRGLGAGNVASNLRVQTKSANRSFKRNSDGTANRRTKKKK